MGGVGKTFALAIAAISTAVALAVLYAWAGPGLGRIAPPAAGAVLFDEEKVQQIYDRASPAVVEIVTDEGAGHTWLQSGEVDPIIKTTWGLN